MREGQGGWPYNDIRKNIFFPQNEIVDEEMTTELKRKNQIRKFKQISYWFSLKPNTLNKTAIQNENDSEEQHPCS